MFELLVIARFMSNSALGLFMGMLIVNRIAGRTSLQTLSAMPLAMLVITGLAAQIVLVAYDASPEDGFLAWNPILLLCTATWSGKILAARLLLGVALAAVTLGPPDRLAHIAMPLAAANLFLLPFSGHAASVDPWWPSAVLHGVHTLTVSAWAGSVPILARDMWRASEPAVRHRLVTRFSPVAMALVGFGIATGLAAACLQLGTPVALFGTPYGQLLLLKAVVLFGIALGCAGWLRWAYLSRPEQLSPFRALVLEAAVCLGMIAIASIMSLSIPGRHGDILWPLPFRFDFRLLAPASDVATVLWGHLGFAAVMWVIGLGALALRRWTLAAITGFAGLLIGSLGLTGLVVPAYPKTFAASPSAYSVDRLSRAETLFAEHCAMCHGKTGRGDGNAMKAVGTTAADLTAPHTGDHTAGDMYWWITHGRPDTVMEGVESETTEQDRWDLVNHVRLLTNSARSVEVGHDATPMRPFLPSIDFTYSASDGQVETLRDAEGVQPVLLVLAREPWSADRLTELQAQQARLHEAKLMVIFVCGPELRDVIAEAGHPGGIAVVKTQADAIIRMWSYYRRLPGFPDLDDTAINVGHQEYLIDRFGYVRAKWRSDDGMMPSVDSIIEKAVALATEPQLLPSPEQHLH